tara:strand:- start:29 stop:367 length:339 start_codon:yes stop_codon:yes gene_type:complete
MRLEYTYQLLPYCLQKMEDDIGGWIPLNRDYKPFNHATKDGWAEYEKVPANARIKRLTLPQMKFLSLHQDIDKNTKIIYLYSNYCHPSISNKAWRQYSEKLQRLGKYSTIER